MTDDSLTLDAMRSLHGLVDELCALLEREYREISGRGEAATIEAIAREKLALFEAIGVCPRPWPPADDAPAMQHEQWRALQQSLALVHRRNERNGIAIARILDTVGDEIILLTGRERAGETYGPRGSPAPRRGRLHTSV